MEKNFILSQDGLQIPCKFTLPEAGTPRRIVLGVHGLGGSTNDAIQVGIAEEMELFYSAVMRFDFPAHGESPMTDAAFSLKNCMTSLLAAARYARQQLPEVEDLCIFATGFGAYVTLLCLEDLLEMPGQVKLVVQTPALVMNQTLLAMGGISRETFWALDKITFNAPRPFSVTYQFYEELEQNLALTSYPIPMLILHGEDDAYIRMEHIQQFKRLNDRAKLVIIPGTSHRFEEDGAWDMVLDLTRDWFEFEQVLLADCF